MTNTERITRPLGLALGLEEAKSAATADANRRVNQRLDTQELLVSMLDENPNGADTELLNRLLDIE